MWIVSSRPFRTFWNAGLSTYEKVGLLPSAWKHLRLITNFMQTKHENQIESPITIFQKSSKPRDVSKKTNFWLKLTLYFIFTISQSPNKNAATCEEVRWEWADHISQLHQDMAIFTKTWLAGSTKGGNTTKGCWNFRWWNSLPLGLFDPASVCLPALAHRARNILASYQRTWEQEMMHCNWCWHWDVENMHLQHCRIVKIDTIYTATEEVGTDIAKQQNPTILSVSKSSRCFLRPARADRPPMRPSKFKVDVPPGKWEQM